MTRSARVTTRNIGFAAVAAAGLGLAPFALQPFALALLSLGLAYGLFAFGLDMAWGRAGVVSIGHAAFFGLGAYGVAIAERFGAPAGVGGVIAVVLAILLALAVSMVGLQARATVSTMAILTLALTLLLEQISRSWIPVTNGSNGLFVSSRGLIADYYVTLIMVVLTVAIVWSVVLRGKWGRRFLTVFLNSQRAAHLGVPVRRTMMLAFALSAAIAALAGVLAAPVMGLVTPATTGIALSAQVLVWLAVGGRGTIIGAFLGAILITMGSQYLGDVLGSGYLLALGVLFLLVVRFAPSGLVGLAQRILGVPSHLQALQGAWLPTVEPRETGTATGDHSVQTNDVRKTFGATPIVRGVSFAARSGESVCIIGPNGAGKTTFLNVVAGDVDADSGSVYIGGEDATRWPVHRRARAGMGKVFQIPSVFAELSPASNITLARAESAHPSALPVRLQRFEADDSRPASSLPLADLRALELASVLAWSPRVILLDEPAAGLSHDESMKLAGLLRESARHGGSTLIVVEHDMEIVRELADRVVVLADGAILTEGSLDEVAANEDVQSAYLGRT